MGYRRASVQQLKLIMLLEDLTGEHPMWNRRRSMESVMSRISEQRARRRIAGLVRVADRRGVETWRWKPFPVERRQTD